MLQLAATEPVWTCAANTIAVKHNWALSYILSYKKYQQSFPHTHTWAVKGWNTDGLVSIYMQKIWSWLNNFGTTLFCWINGVYRKQDNRCLHIRRMSVHLKHFKSDVRNPWMCRHQTTINSMHIFTRFTVSSLPISSATWDTAGQIFHPPALYAMQIAVHRVWYFFLQPVLEFIFNCMQIPTADGS